MNITAQWLKSEGFEELLQPPRFALKLNDISKERHFPNEYLITTRFSGILDSWYWSVESRSALMHTWDKYSLPTTCQPQDTEHALALISVMKGSK